jgi:NADPH-dependent F420 reductase
MHRMVERVDSDSQGAASAITSVGIIGGTGALGRGLAHRFGRAGLSVVIGSRDGERARDVSASLGDKVTGGTNLDACSQGVTIIAVPWPAHRETLLTLAPHLGAQPEGHVLIDAVNPLGFDERGPFALDVAAGSAAQEAEQLLPLCTVVGAFHHLSAGRLHSDDELDSDVLVVGDDRTAVNRVISLVGLIAGLRGVAAGRLRNAKQVEALTANILAINRRYGVQAGLRVTGLDDV